eukprot:Phypoly_transcript_14073.p1 GENE.Phypoly_transcript_14073~~Phypoly_transcript_14073.p1  ORF type:complete len:327 (+),score=38.24 Phypoly_transcript_14073:82-981(+)
MRLYDLNLYLLQYIIELLPVEGMAKCTLINQHFRTAANATINRKYKGKTALEINVMNTIEEIMQSYKEDLKEVFSMPFTAGYGVDNPNEENFLLAKVVMLGAKECGATSLQARMNLTHFHGREFSILRFLYEGQHLRIQFWDKPVHIGSEFDIPSTYFRDANVIIILYDTSKGTSVISYIDKWLEILNRHVPTNGGIPLFVGTKSDIRVVAKFTLQEIQRHVIRKCIEIGYMGGSGDSNGFPKFPYVIETRTDGDGSIDKVERIAALLAIRHKRSLVPILEQQPKKSIVSSLRNFFGKN